MEKELGIVRRFSEPKGRGFIQRCFGGEDVFVHYTGIEGQGRRSLAEGDVVEFLVTEGRKGLQAEQVRLLK